MIAVRERSLSPRRRPPNLIGASTNPMNCQVLRDRAGDVSAHMDRRGADPTIYRLSWARFAVLTFGHFASDSRCRLVRAGEGLFGEWV